MSDLPNNPALTPSSYRDTAGAGHAPRRASWFLKRQAPLDAADAEGVGSAEDPPVRRRFRFRITSEGYMLLIVMVLVGFAAWHSGTNLLYLVFSVLVAIYLLHGFVLSINLSRLTVAEDIPAMAVAGQPFSVTLTIRNKKRWISSHSIRMVHESTERHPLGIVQVFQVPPAGSADGTYSVTINRRGIFKVGRLRIATRYPFGFEEREQVHNRSREILLLPQTFPVTSILTQMPSGFGDQESLVRGSGTDLYGLREYVAGEPIRNVHWRTSARAQKLMIAEYTREERQQTLLILDNAAPTERHNELMDAFENAVTLTASLARHLMENGHEVGLVTQDANIIPGQGNARLTEIMRVLALIQLVDRQPINRHLTGLRITFELAREPAARSYGRIIDSTTWRPSQTVPMAGEKAF